jgi:hypothetical protein
MKRYTYSVLLGDKQCECPNVLSAVKFINEAIGCELVSTSMVFNYFSRPEVVNKKLFGQFIKIHRIETKLVSSSSSEQTQAVSIASD